MTKHSFRTVHPLLARYDALVESGAIERDGAQVAVLSKLEALARQLAEHRPAPGPHSRGKPARGLAKRALAWLSRPRPTGAPRGLYVWGKVGRGKTMLMDLFFDALDVEKKRRVHFHAFMANVHERLHSARQAAHSGGGTGDLVAQVAADLMNETRILCFDEFTVSDIADATILSRLFGALFADGVVVVATSNVEPQRLYEGGRNRALFLPFITLLQERLEVVRLEAKTDFRLEKISLGEVYHVPHGERSRRAIDALFHELTGEKRGEPMALELKRRRIEIPQAAKRVARFDFADLCTRPLGSSDYLELARNFDTIIVEGVPAMGFDRRNEAKRFITLVDVLYERKVKLVLSAQAQAHELYDAPTGHEAQEFQRTVSRLIEMRSEEYLDGDWRSCEPEGSRSEAPFGPRAFRLADQNPD